MTRIKPFAEPGRYGDGGGLYLSISKSGTKSWVQRMTADGRRRDLGLGGYICMDCCGFAVRLAASDIWPESVRYSREFEDWLIYG